MISPWVMALLFATLLTVIPFASVLRLLSQLPAALALSYRRLPPWGNALVVSVVTGVIALFIRIAYLPAVGPPVPSFRVAIMFAIAVLVYAFGLVILLRQFCGVYPEYIVTVRALGLMLQKTSYRNITDVERVAENAGEVGFRVKTSRGTPVFLMLPLRHGETFYAQLRRKMNGE